ncbi:Sigma-70 family RNA polymerase sigma factor, partial [Dysosmobacter welbionis]
WRRISAVQMPQITKNRAIRALAPSPHIQTQERKIADTPAAVTSSASGWNRSCRKVPAPPKRFSALTMTEAGTSSRART